jgi:hypothetical protein
MYAWLAGFSHYNQVILIIPVGLRLESRSTGQDGKIAMFTDHEGPIERFEWGLFQINGEVHSAEGRGVGKDICIVGGVVRPWQERKGHRLKTKMVLLVLKPDVEILVIGNGVNGAIRVPEKTRQAIKTAGIVELIIEKTPAACEIYNRLVGEGKAVALLAHGTC